MRDLPQTMAMQQLQGSSDCAPITRDELVEMFGEDMPIEAVNLLRNTPGCMTIGEVRVELRKMAMQQLQGSGAGQMSDLVERLRGYRREPPQLMLEAADRIEALEAVLRQIGALDQTIVPAKDRLAIARSLARAALEIEK